MWHQKAKGPPDGPPIFLIFVEKLNCPQSQAYQSISPVGTGLSLTDRALGVSLGTSIGNYSPLIAPQPVKLKIKCRKACRFESGHRHHGVRAKSAPLKIRQLKTSCRIFSSALPCSSFNAKNRMNNQMNGISPSNKLLVIYMEAGRGVAAYLENQISNEALYWADR